MTFALTVLSGALLALGCFFCLTGAVGLVRFPDLYSRLHAAGVTDTAGAALVLAALAVRTFADGHGDLFGDVLIVSKLFFILLFMWVSGTTACHALAKAAYLDGLEPWTADSGRDDADGAGGAPSRR